jgi:hypothetical protein
MATRAGSSKIEELSEATSLLGEDQFLFFQNSSKKTKRVSRANMFSSNGIVVQGKIIDPDYGDLGVATATATANAATALSTANAAQTSADGKAKVYYQTTAPTGGTYNAGDLWYDTDDNYKLYVRSGGSWVASFAPLIKLNGNNNITGLIKADGTDKDFVLIADNFQVWNGVSSTAPFRVDTGTNTVYIKNAVIETVDAGKLTAGFISSQAIELANSNAYIQSNNFVITWASGLTCKIYNGAAANLGKSAPSDVVRCKVLQADGSYKAFKSLQDHTSSSGNQPPSSGSNSYWEEITVPTLTVDLGGGETASIDNFGFNIVGQGQAEFAGVLIRGAIIAKTGYFGTTKNAAKIDSNGLTIGNYGRIKSAGIGYNGTDFTSTSGSGGFFLGNTQAEGSSALYQFFIGDPSSNYMRWNGSVLAVNGNIIGGSTVGANGGSVGLIMNTQYGIRRSVDNGTLTITGGSGNGIYYGSQIDLVGSTFSNSASDNGSGTAQISAGYRSSTNYNGPYDGAIVFRTLREYNAASGATDGHSGAQRFRVELDGTVRVLYTPSNTSGGTIEGYVRYEESALNLNPGRFLVEGSANGKHVQIKDGKIEFLSGDLASAVDTNLYRYGTDALGTDDDLYIGGSTTRYLYFPNGGQIVWASDTNLYRSGAGTLKTDDDFIAASVTTTSSKKTKKNIKKYKGGLDIVEKLKPVSFTRKMDDKNDIGFIAEDVNELVSTIVAKNDNGEVEGLDYSKLTVILVNAVKELKKEVEKLKNGNSH